MLALVYCRYGSHELIADNCEANQAGLLTLNKMYDELTTGNSTLIVFCFYNTVRTLFASEPVNFELRLTVLNFLPMLSISCS